MIIVECGVREITSQSWIVKTWQELWTELGNYTYEREYWLKQVLSYENIA